MSEEEFIDQARVFNGSTSSSIHSKWDEERPAFDTRLNRTTKVFFDACSIVATSIPYVADYADLNKGRTEKTGAFERKKSHITTESFDDALARGADDCEGVARMIARVYVGYRDGSFPPENALLASAQSIAKVYTVVGVLGSVAQHSRNINESAGQEQPKIDSPQDREGGVGAHMWTMFIPTRHFIRLAAKTSQTRLPRLGSGQTYKDFPEWHERLMIGVNEGTGMQNPAILPSSAYHEGIPAKKKAVNASIRKKDAVMRLMSDTSIAEVLQSQQVTDEQHQSSALHFDPPGELSKMQMVRQQSLLTEDRNRRVSNFYMRATTMFGLVRNQDEIHFDVTKAEQKVPSSWSEFAHDFYRDDKHADPRAPYKPRSDVPDPVYSWRLLIPVEAGERPSKWNGTFGPWGDKAERYNPHNARWGVNLGDMVYKREHVALLRGPSTTTRQEKTIGSILRHLPPLAEMRSLTDGEKREVEEKTERHNRILMNTLMDFEASNPGVRHGPVLSQNSAYFDSLTTDKTELLMLYIKSQDTTEEQIRLVSKRVAQCPFALGARFVAEQVIPDVGNYRLEVVINMDNAASMNERTFHWITPHAM
jgi:hypothetical protein